MVSDGVNIFVFFFRSCSGRVVFTNLICQLLGNSWGSDFVSNLVLQMVRDWCMSNFRTSLLTSSQNMADVPYNPFHNYISISRIRLTLHPMVEKSYNN